MQTSAHSLFGRQPDLELLGAFVDQGASKFVVVPLVAPRDWRAELADLRERVAVPLEN